MLGGIVRGVAGSAITQGIAVATGLQKRFDWVGVAAAGVSGGVIAGVGGAIGYVPGSASAANIGRGVVAGFAGDLANAATRSLAEGSDFGDNVLAGLPDVIAQTVGTVISGALARSRQSAAEKALLEQAQRSADNPTPRLTVDPNALYDDTVIGGSPATAGKANSDIAPGTVIVDREVTPEQYARAQAAANAAAKARPGQSGAGTGLITLDAVDGPLAGPNRQFSQVGTLEDAARYYDGFLGAYEQRGDQAYLVRLSPMIAAAAAGTVTTATAATTETFSLFGLNVLSYGNNGFQLFGRNGITIARDGINVGGANGVTIARDGFNAGGAYGVNITSGGLRIGGNNGVVIAGDGFSVGGPSSIVATVQGVSLGGPSGIVATTRRLTVGGPSGIVVADNGFSIGGQSGLVVADTGLSIGGNYGLVIANNGVSLGGYTVTVGPSTGSSGQRPSWRTSEIDVGSSLKGQDYRSQVSFKNGQEVAYGTSGSVRPDYYNSGSSIEVKNYNVETARGRASLINNISNQATARTTGLPSGTTQNVYIDVRGQAISRADLSALSNQIVQRSNGAIQPGNIKFVR